MKKNKFKLLVIAGVLFGASLHSCKKETENNKTTPSLTVSATHEINVTAKNNLLIFKSKRDYEIAVNNPTEETKKKFLEKVNNLTSFVSINKLMQNNKEQIQQI